MAAIFVPSRLDWQDVYERDLTCYTQADERSAYGLSYLATLLERTGSQARQLCLLVGNQAWMEAKAQAFQGDNRYLEELRRAADHAVRGEATDLAALAALHTAQQVVWQRTRALNDDCIEAMVRLGRMVEARNVLRLRVNPLDRLKGTLVLFRLAPSRTQLEQEFFAEATSAMEDIKPRHEQAEALRLIASEVCAKEADAGRDWFARALAAAGEIEDELRRVREFETLCEVLSQHKLFEQAEAAWREIEPVVDDSGDHSSRALQSMAIAYAQIGRSEAAQDALNRIPDAQRTVRAARDLAQMRTPIPFEQRVGWYVQAKRFNRALPEKRRIDLAPTLARLYAFSGRGDKATAVLTKLADSVTVAETGIAIAELIRGDIVSAGHAITAAARAIETVSEPAVKVRWLTALGVLMRQSSIPDADAVFEQIAALVTATSVRDWSGHEASEAVAVLAQSDCTADAIMVAQVIVNQRQRAVAFGKLAVQMGVKGDSRSAAMLEEASSAAHDVHGEGVRLKQILNIATWLARYRHSACELAFKQAKALIDKSPLRTDAAMEARIRYAAARARAEHDDGIVTLAQLGETLIAKAGEFSSQTKLLYVCELAELGAFDAAEAFANTQHLDWERVGAWIQIAIVLAQRSDPRLNRVLAQAKTEASTIEDIYQGPVTLCALARLLASVGDADCENVLQQMEVLADSANEEWTWQQAETARLEALIWSGYRDEALAALHTLRVNEFAGSVMLCSVEKWCEKGEYDRAEAEVATIQDDQYRDEAWRTIAEYLARAGHIHDAFAAHQPRDLDRFMENVTEWVSQPNKIGDHEAVSIWCECVRVAGWHDPFWRQVYSWLHEETGVVTWTP